jgi:hypothetical protein
MVSEDAPGKARVITSECLSIEQVSREEECAPRIFETAALYIAGKVASRGLCTKVLECI